MNNKAQKKNRKRRGILSRICSILLAALMMIPSLAWFPQKAEAAGDDAVITLTGYNYYGGKRQNITIKYVDQNGSAIPMSAIPQEIRNLNGTDASEYSDGYTVRFDQKLDGYSYPDNGSGAAVSGLDYSISSLYQELKNEGYQDGFSLTVRNNNSNYGWTVPRRNADVTGNQGTVEITLKYAGTVPTPTPTPTPDPMIREFTGEDKKLGGYGRQKLYIHYEYLDENNERQPIPKTDELARILTDEDAVSSPRKRIDLAPDLSKYGYAPFYQVIVDPNGATYYRQFTAAITANPFLRSSARGVAGRYLWTADTSGDGYDPTWGATDHTANIHVVYKKVSESPTQERGGSCGRRIQGRQLP